MDLSVILPQLLDKWGTFTLLFLLGYWLLQKYIPSQQEFYQRQITEQNNAHREEVKLILSQFESSMKDLSEYVGHRLDSFEDTLNNANKK